MCDCAVCEYLDRESESPYLHTTNWNSTVVWMYYVIFFFSSSGKTSCTSCFAALLSHNVAVQNSILRVSSWSAVFVLIFSTKTAVVVVIFVVPHYCFTCIVVFQFYIKILHYIASLILQALHNPI